MEFDNPDEDQKFTLANAKVNIQRRKNAELAALAESHECAKGMLCPVRCCQLCWQVDGEDHAIAFDGAPTRISKAYSLPRTTIRVSLADRGYKGTLACSCTAMDCIPNILRQICNIQRFCAV